MKAILIILICISLLLEGCYSYSAIMPDERGRIVPDPDAAIRIQLKDGTEIDVEGNHFISVEERSQYIFGTGILRGPGSGASRNYVGAINPVLIDSGSGYTSGAWSSRNTARYDFYQNDGSVMRCNRGDFVSVDSLQGPGFWVCGTGGVLKEHPQGLRIPFENITEIGERHFSAGKTALLLVSIPVGTVVGIVIWLCVDNSSIN